MLSLPEPSTAPQNKPLIFQDTLWLGGKHDGFPRVPFTEYLGVRPRISSHSILGDLAELQCLLTFGLLEAVMAVEIAEIKLLRFDSNTGKWLLTSENFPALLRDWRGRIRQLLERKDWDGCRQWASCIQSTLTEANNILNAETSRLWNSTFLRAGLELEVVADILIQIGSIFEALQCSTTAFPKLFPPIIGFSFIHMLALVSWEHRTVKMFANGWCPFTVKTISVSSCMLGYARTLKCPHIRVSEEHGNCTPISCVLNMMDTNENVRQHVAGSCNCDNYKPSLENVVDFLQTDRIPVVQCSPPYDRLSVRNSSNTPFVAISHVWADGLRGTTETGLPACQIKRLAEMTSKILGDPGGAFWNDVLCIPGITDVRNRAIGLMAKTYKDAKAVLVIDSGIREISSSAPRQEKLFYILSSRWMQRLWTFQEAALAQKLYFEFSDGAIVALEELWTGPFTEEDLYNPVLMSLATEVYRLSKNHWVSKEAKGVGFNISDVSSILRWRTTKRESDETLAVSGLLNLDAFELATLSDPEERMQTFLLRIQKLPPAIIFLVGTKVDKVGFCWAPKTFMRGTMATLSGPCVALCTSTGLEAEYESAIIQDTVIDGAQSEWCISHSSRGRIYKVVEIEPRFVKNSHSCNAILLLSNLPEALEGRACAGVHVDPDVVLGGGSGGDRILCEFKRVLFLRDITGTELDKSSTVVNAKVVRRMKVKVV